MQTLSDITEPAFWADPAGSYASILAQDDWLFHNPYSDGLIATRYRAIEELARHPDMQAVDRQKRRKSKTAQSPTSRMLAQHPNFMNMPEHATARRRAFDVLAGPGGARLKALVSEVTVRFASSLQGGQNDLVAHYAAPIAAEVWSRLVTGVPDHAGFLAENAEPIARLMAFETSMIEVERADGGSTALLDWARHHVPPEVQGLVAAMSFDAIDGAAGIASNALWLLASRSDLWERLSASRALVLPFLMEAERLYPSVLGLERSSQKTLLAHGAEIPAGTNVLFLNCVANRDPLVFDAPNDVDLDNPRPKALSFGLGSRSCAGRMLARLVSEAAINALLDRCRHVRLTSKVYWGPPGQLRTAQSLLCHASLRA